MRIFKRMALAAAFALATSAAAYAQEPVTIEADVVQPMWSNGTGPSYVGDFVARGGIADEGYAAFYDGYALWLHLQGANGDISIAFDADGWSVASGTGAYEDLRGSGAVATESYLAPSPWLPGTYLWGIRFTLTGTVEFVANDPPVAELAVASVDDLTVDLSAAGSRDPDGNIVRYEWDFDGDGRDDLWTTGPDARHTYGAAGTYAVTVRVVDDRGATDTASANVTVQAPAPPPDDGKGGGKGKGGGNKGKKK